ncbi:MAG: wax ester/triacylglycerol synthase family O-acyltransferase, partial [Deltaproteobacteria bacterium]
MSAGYERLSAQDSSFLVFEDQNTHMHLGGIAIFDAGPLATPDGGVNIERIRRHVASRLHWIPRYRQRIAYIPLERHPVWVDDDHFNLSYHVRHTSLPRPGDEEQLKRLAGRVMSQRLDRRRPLWEIWIVEGLEGGRFAMVTKTHHCMVDGVAAVDLNAILLSPTPEYPQEDATPWVPRPAPGPLTLLRDEALRQIRRPLALGRWLGSTLQAPDVAPGRVAERVSAAWQTISAGLRGAARTPLNAPIGPHRRFDWLTLDLGEVKGVKERFGGTVNDVVLATVAGGVRRFLRKRRVSLEGMDYRIVVPVSVRSEDERGRLTNRASG